MILLILLMKNELEAEDIERKYNFCMKILLKI